MVTVHGTQIMLKADCRGDTRPARGSKLTLLSRLRFSLSFARTVDGYHPSKSRVYWFKINLNDAQICQVRAMYKLTFKFPSEQSKGLNQLKWEKFSTRHIWKSIITLYAGYVLNMQPCFR